MQVETNATVTYDVKNVTINNIMVHKMRTELMFMIPYEWIDSNGVRIEQAMKRFTQTELIQLGTSINQDLSPIVAVLTGILTTNNSHLRIDLSKAPVLSGTVIAKVNDKWVQTKLEGEAFTTAITPLTVENILGIVQMISIYLTTI